MKITRPKFKPLFFFLIFSLSFFLLIFFSIEPDYLWHIKAGEYMFHHGILTQDIFSWYVNGKYWMSHEWLFEILLYVLRLLFGDIHVFLYCFFSLFGLFICIFYPNRDGFLKNIPYSLFYLFFFCLMSLVFVQARPHLLSYLFFSITVYFLYDLYKNERSKKIYFLPLISVLWSNLHGGSSNLVYLMCFLFLFAGCFSFQFRKIEAHHLTRIQVKKYFFVMILCMLFININPHGFSMFFYPYLNMADSTMIQNIGEWQSTSLNVFYHYTYYLFLVFLVVTMLFSDKKIEWLDFLLLGFAAYLGLKSIRFWLFTPIVVSFFIFTYVSKRKIDKGTFSILFVVSCILILISLFNIHIPLDYHYGLNDEVIDVIKKEHPKRLFNMYDYGGDLIYHDISVFIDGRADLYGKYNYKDYLNISTLNGDYVSLISKYDFDYFLVQDGYPISTYLKYQDDYVNIYQSENIIFYKKIVNQ